jgi:hypothetical protein
VLLDCFQLKKELEELTARMGQQTVQENKEGSLSESSCKEEETSADKGAVLVKEETGTCANKEGAEEEAEVSRPGYCSYVVVILCLILLRSIPTQLITVGETYNRTSVKLGLKS